ncbi:uncharacterized protein LOC114251248 [Bombyx mandarina]|uniref:Uncharacterized protein LOC114251248 n=1 Tax=Bombyx mandarina TaxID=7092 RepID=A0A6J2KGV1_BOMMA|nr:uncharacterized protein LOC114251248 [Bombyx mandarina]
MWSSSLHKLTSTSGPMELLVPSPALYLVCGPGSSGASTSTTEWPVSLDRTPRTPRRQIIRWCKPLRDDELIALLNYAKKSLRMKKLSSRHWCPERQGCGWTKTMRKLEEKMGLILLTSGLLNLFAYPR